MVRSRVPHIVTGAVLAVVAAGQVRVWSSGRGFWLDELSVAINLRERSWSELAGWLEYHQVAPVGWLAAGKALRGLLGEHELVLRLPSLVAGLAVLGLTVLVTRRAVGEWAAAAAVGMVGLSSTILYYSGELKQYATESAVALGLLLLGGALARRDRIGRDGTGPAWPPWPLLAGWAVAAAAALTLSYSGLIVLAGVAAGLGTGFLARRRWRSLAVLAIVTVPAALVGGALAAYRRSLPMAPGLDAYFADAMPPGDGARELVAWLPRMWTGFVADPRAGRSPGATLLLVAGGLGALVARQRHHWAAMFAGVLVFAVVAAGLRGFPLGDRVALYLVAPVTVLAVAALDGLVRALAGGAAWLGARGPALARPVAVSLAAGLAVAAGPGLGDGVAEAREPRNPDLGREVLADLGGRVRAGDVVIAHWFSEQLVRWYGPGAGVEVAGLVRLYPADESGNCRPEPVDALVAGARRVWYLHGAPVRSEPDGYTAQVVQDLARRGTVVDARSAGAGAFSDEPGWALLDLTAGPDPSPPPAGPVPEPVCLGYVAPLHERQQADERV